MSKNTKKRKRVLVIHGPNLQLLGKREPNIYGNITLSEINKKLRRLASKHNVHLTIVHSNIEGKIVDIIGKAAKRFDGILINPAAYTHTSVAIRDALLAVKLPAVEVHLSNIASREEFRHKSLISPVVKGTIMGFGMQSYLLGFQALLDLIT
ncbi:MAG: type II 3-dehydroquinate dehydratase [Candidatus Omnitrophica bacterium]|nr:type II 3-dehydroquinate dehydratase [Candidatus Omnitrophota bacterium]